MSIAGALPLIEHLVASGVRIASGGTVTADWDPDTGELHVRRVME